MITMRGYEGSQQRMMELLGKFEGLNKSNSDAANGAAPSMSGTLPGVGAAAAKLPGSGQASEASKAGMH